MPDPKTLFMRLDKDKDKKLTLEEFSEGMRAFHRPVPTQPRSAAPAMGPPGVLLERLKLADKNKDGKLGKDEAPGPLKERFEKLDADKDGSLGPDELRRAAAILHRAGGPARGTPMIQRPLRGKPDALRPQRPDRADIRPPAVKRVVKPPVRPQVLKPPPLRKPEAEKPIERKPKPKARRPEPKVESSDG